MKNFWDVCIEILFNREIKTIFGMVGDGGGLLEAAHTCNPESIHIAYDQRVAIAMASGFTKAANKPVCYVASPGPGLANLSMGLLEAKSQCLPIIVVSNGVSRNRKGLKSFQEFESLNFMKSMTKWAYRAETQAQAFVMFNHAIYIAQCGKPGPVYLEIPDDIIREEVTDIPAFRPWQTSVYQPEQTMIERAITVLTTCEKPLLLLGGGCVRSEGAGALAAELADIIGAGIMCTASGRGAISENHPLFLGISGLYKMPEVESILEQMDCLFVIGSQCEETALMGMEDCFISKQVIHLNIDPEDANSFMGSDLPLVGDASKTLASLIPLIKKEKICERKAWREALACTRKQILEHWSNVPEYSKAPVRMMFKELSNHFGGNVHLVMENGLNDMWGYFWPIYNNESGQFFVPGEHTGLGLALGGAIGFKLVFPSEYVFCVIGDGAFNFGEGAIKLCQQLSIIFIVINNGGFGWPKLMQSLDDVSVGCRFVISDLERVANENNCHYEKVSDGQTLADALAQAKHCHAQNKSMMIELMIGESHDLPIGVIQNFMS